MLRPRACCVVIQSKPSFGHKVLRLCWNGARTTSSRVWFHCCLNAELGFDCCWYHPPYRACVCERASLPVYTAQGDTPCLHSCVCLRLGLPSPFLFYLLPTATANMQAGRRLTHLDHRALRPTHFPATSPLCLWRLYHHSSPGHLIHRLSHFLSLCLLHIQILNTPQVVCCPLWNDLMAVSSQERVLTCKKFLSLVNVWPDSSPIQLAFKCERCDDDILPPHSPHSPNYRMSSHSVIAL